MSKKVEFHKFNNDIYPTALIVAVTNSQSAIFDMFLDENGNELKELPENCDALVVSVTERSTKKRYDLVVFRKKEYMSVAAMAHEAFHATLNMCEKLGITITENDNNEAFAYFLGWVVDCINQVRIGKFKYD